MEALSSFIAMDRRRALAQGHALPDRSIGAVLFADISGFTPLTEAFLVTYGPQRGSEELTGFVNHIYERLTREVDRYSGSVMGFSGDGMTCWFDNDDSQRAVTCGVALQAAMHGLECPPLVALLNLSLALKVAVAFGPVRRLLVGAEQYRRIEVLVGATMDRLACAEQLARKGEIVLDAYAAEQLAGNLVVLDQRRGPTGALYTVVEGLKQLANPQPWPLMASEALQATQIRSWVAPAVYDRLQIGGGTFLSALRPVVALFLRFSGLVYDADETAGSQLDTFIRWVQDVLNRYEGTLIDVTIGDKGSYLYAAFGAPLAHTDDIARAVEAALDLRTAPVQVRSIIGIQIGISGGHMRTGTYGGTTRTYGVLGDAVNLAARLMQHAESGQILLDARLSGAVNRYYALYPLAPIAVKGKKIPISVVRISGRRTAPAIRLQEPQYALPLVGRIEPLTQIEAKLVLACAGQGQIVTITAEAGMGKSRLVAEIIQRATATGLVGFGGEALSYGANSAYLPWQSIWWRFFGLDPEAPLATQIATLEHELEVIHPTLVARLPLLGMVLNLPLADTDLTRTMDARLRKESLEELLVTCLQARAATTPLLLVLEDIHWLDPLSLDLLLAVSRMLAALPVLLVLTRRTAETDQNEPAPFATLAYATDISLGELTTIEVAQLVRLHLPLLFDPQTAVADSLVAWLVARTEGNPFYIEELLNYIRDRAISLTDPVGLATVELPESLASLILSRIDRLTLTQQMTLKVASVVGRIFPVAWLWGSFPDLGPVPHVDRDIKQLAQLDITPLATLEPELRYMFKHAIIQDVVYESIPFALRSQLHNQLGTWLETTLDPATSPDLLAFHYGRSNNTERQRFYFRAAGEAAAARYANMTSIGYYERLLPLLEPHEQAAMLLRLGELLNTTSAWDESEARYRMALNVADSLCDERLAAEARLGIGTTLRSRGKPIEAEPWLEAAQRGFDALGNPAGITKAMLSLAHAAWQRGDLGRSQILLEEQLPILVVRNDTTGMADALRLLGNVASSQQDLHAAQQWWQQSLQLERSLGKKEAVAMLTDNLAIAALLEGRLNEAQNLVSTAMNVFKEIGARREYGLACDILAEILIEQGAILDAQTLILKNLELYRELGAQTEFAVSMIGLAKTFTHAIGGSGDYGRALMLVGTALRLNACTGATMIPLHYRRAEAILATAQAALGQNSAAPIWEASQSMDWLGALLYVDQCRGAIQLPDPHFG